MRILILGGTVFLGRALTDAALARGHAVTHFHRGVSAARDERVETLIGDRVAVPFMGGAGAARAWDAVVDTSGYLPQVVSRSCAALAQSVGTYAFISSISAYASFESENFGEDAPLQADPVPWPDETTPEIYGALKAACERVVSRALGERALIVRPGLIVGPHDPTDRFTWWPWRAAKSGSFVAPGRHDRRVQFVDVRDVADWVLAMLERSRRGAFQVTGPREATTLGDLIDACCVATRTSAAPEWIPDDFLLEQGIRPWVEMPLWLPERDPGYRGFMSASIERAVSEGLAFRPLPETVADTLAWARTRPGDHAWKAGIREDREAAMLEAWKG